MNTKPESLRDCLKSRGMRDTKQRQAILKVLVDEERPLTAAVIFSRLEEKFSGLRLSTIYRNLNTFVEKNIVRKMELDFNNKESYFEYIKGEHHHHLICVECNEIVPLDCPLKEYETELKSETNYTLLDHKIKIYGICPECQRKE
ncbi:MAG: Fur family transcriptional regulator [Halanaerobiales bacterium]